MQIRVHRFDSGTRLQKKINGLDHFRKFADGPAKHLSKHSVFVLFPDGHASGAMQRTFCAGLGGMGRMQTNDSYADRAGFRCKSANGRFESGVVFVKSL